MVGKLAKRERPEKEILPFILITLVAHHELILHPQVVTLHHTVLSKSYGIVHIKFGHVKPTVTWLYDSTQIGMTFNSPSLSYRKLQSLIGD